MDKRTKLVTFAWGLTAIVTLLAILAWGQGISWNFGRLSTYRLFPLFGLLAFSLMWTHYIVAAARQYLGLEKGAVKQYFNLTSFAVLVAICLHPGLFIWQLWRDGFGLPPQSYLGYINPSLKLAVAAGSVSFLVFLAYEFHRWFSKKSWWRYIQYASDAAMLAIIYHSLKLGSNLQEGWLLAVWYFYAATYVAALIYIYSSKQKTAKS